MYIVYCHYIYPRCMCPSPSLPPSLPRSLSPSLPSLSPQHIVDISSGSDCWTGSIICPSCASICYDQPGTCSSGNVPLAHHVHCHSYPNCHTLQHNCTLCRCLLQSQPHAMVRWWRQQRERVAVQWALPGTQWVGQVPHPLLPS